MTETLPVSVVIPAYNRAHLLPRTLASVAAQRPHLPAEVIVVDDCSSDDSAETAERLGARVIRHERNQGAAAARNTGIAAATQPWIALLDSDDEWLPHHLETLWRLRGDHVLVAGSALSVGEDPAADRLEGPIGRRPTILRTPARLVWPENYIPASGVMVRRDALERAGGYNTSLRYAEDFDLWIRLLEEGTGVASPEVVSIYHRHDDQKSRGRRPQATQRQIAEAYQGRAWWSPALVERRVAVRAWDNFRGSLAEGDRRDAVRQAAWIAARPQRIAGVAGLLTHRFRVRRQSATVTRDGGPSVALLPGPDPWRDAARRTLAERPLVDLSDAGPVAALAHLARRPTRRAIVSSPFQAVAVRALGVRPSRSPRAPGG